MPNKTSKRNKNKKSINSLDSPAPKKMKINEISEKVEVVKSTEFVLTDEVVASVNLLKWCIEQGVCVLLSGPVGSGKTALVEYLSGQMKKSLIKLQISDDTDARTLLGGYCCTEIPGRFEWRQGPLLSAMTRGSWLLLEDVACGQTNLLGLLRPLLESTTLGLRASLPDPMQPQKSILAHTDFRLIVTQSLLTLANGYAEPRIASTSYGSNCLSKCQPIVMHSISPDSLRQIITQNYPSIVKLIPKLIGEQSLLQFVMSPSDCKEQSRINSARDLFNFCRRITNLDSQSAEQIATSYFMDASDCFVNHIPDEKYREKLLSNIGSVFNLNENTVESILKFRTCKISGDVVRNDIINIGRVQLKRKSKGSNDFINPSNCYAQTRQLMHLLQSLARCVQMQEPVLLVSETGCGKTSTVQYLSKLVNRNLTVINMNQQSDSSDLLGGYKPVNNAFSDAEIAVLKNEVAEIVEHFKQTFATTFSSAQNKNFLTHVKNTQESNDFEKIINLIGNDVISKAVSAITTMPETLKAEWTLFYSRVEEIKKKMLKMKCNLTFLFIEGALVQALKNGDWVLLDEINLAPPEMLQSLSGLLESTTGSLTLVERGDDRPVVRHPDFRLFACMNPATDVGKRNLPQGLRNRFTEFYLQELTDLEELIVIVKHYIGSLTPKVIECVVKFYLALRDDAKSNRIVDGGGSRPHFSLRTLCRALDEIRNFINNELYRTTIVRALYEGLSFSFKSQLSDDSRALFDSRFETFFSAKIQSLETSSVISKCVTTEMLSQKGFKVIQGYPIKLGLNYSSNIEETDEFVKGYKITKSVSKNLKDLSRIISGGKTLPVLVQGETSVGKTSLIMYLAKLTGNIYHRINNHESTDIQEYLGCYVNESGKENGSSDKLVFKEGVLAQAMRKGHWIILDELNLAPTDILEALNRVLDDNRELFIPETQTTITAHPMFRIFATQNPPGRYGGRKVLSRALRNRFIELHFNPIPNNELIEILDECCKMPKSRGVKMVEAMRLMQTDSQDLDVVHCKRNYISLRDLFRWARRVHQEHTKAQITFDWDRHMIEEGYLLLTGKARSEEDVNLVAKILKKVFKNVDSVQLNDDWFFSSTGSNIAQSILSRCEQVSQVANIEWTHDFRRMAVLLIRAIECDEPTLLVGNTGCGKTTICQLAAHLYSQKLLSINCHMHTEASDFLGGLRPSTNQDGGNRLFNWVDGPLVTAMKEGNMFLIDEISLADDSVLERLNSVLESDRKLTLVENGEMNVTSDVNDQSIEIRASKGFQVFATMNPGGDFGKKELSPALKNRFTEIWCPSNSWCTNDRGLSDWINIAARNLFAVVDLDHKIGTAHVLVHFLRSVYAMANEISFSVVSIRDLLSWVEFINLSTANALSLFEAIVHGAHMVIIDSINDKINKSFYEKKLIGLLYEKMDAFLSGVRTDQTIETDKYELSVIGNKVGMAPFYIDRGALINQFKSADYSFSSKTTGSNLWRLLRALQISKKPLLLEGSPGVGKTSLVSQLAKVAGFRVVRINLSEQTDANDLFGCFLPIENGGAGQLCWRDGPLLQALKNGDWILLDEMNLASQSVLESLNACLDHRGEIFIPELNQSFMVKPGQTRIFACQNPMSEGGGRKGLPKSFVNRFTQVYMSSLQTSDYEEILACLYPAIPIKSVRFIVEYVQALKEEVVRLRKFGTKGSPWEFNLRDLCRWCELMISKQSRDYEPAFFVTLLFIDRFRSQEDKDEAKKLYNILAEKHQQAKIYQSGLQLHITDQYIRVGQAQLEISQRSHRDSVFQERNLILKGQLGALESMMLTVKMGWMTILVGPSGAGKTSLVHILASLTGNKLQTMSMNSAMDTTDLLGSFEQQQDGGKFKWMDSMLVHALKNGDWLVLDTVNFCNASVLDRLNGLLEPNGTLLLTERGLLDGNQLEEVKPHPNFRIFLVLDPECGGEISKAMRNRGLEISFVKGDNQMNLAEEDVLSILVHVHRLTMTDAQAIVDFQRLLNDARGDVPQIRIGNVTSMLQVGALMSRKHTLQQALISVYGETQMFFNVRKDVNKFIGTFTIEEAEDLFLSILSLCSIVTDPVNSLVRRDLEVFNRTKAICNATTTDDKVILARIFMTKSSKVDLNIRLNSVSDDQDLQEVCQTLAKMISECPGIQDSLPFDVRYLPFWSEFKEVPFTQENRTLFKVYNINNEITDAAVEKMKAVKPSQLTRDSIDTFNIEEISKLFSTGKLSRNLVSKFKGLDKQTGEFIDMVKSVDFAGLCTPYNVHQLRNICKMVNRFCGTHPGQGNHWLSTYVYHVSEIMDQMKSHAPLNKVCREILEKINSLDLCQDSAIHDNNDLKFSIIKRSLLRSEYPHSDLIFTKEEHEVLFDQMNVKNCVSIWKASNGDRLKDVLSKIFSSITGSSLNIADLANTFDIDSLKIWPFLLNMLTVVLNSLTFQNGKVQLLHFFNDLSKSKFHLPSLPCDLQTRIEKINSVSEYTMVTDWVKYLASQAQMNKILSSCKFQLDRESEEYSLHFELSSGFLKSDIISLWSSPDNAVFLLISGVDDKEDAVAYFNSLKHCDLAKRNLRSVKERKSQLEFCKDTLMKSSALLSSDQFRKNYEINTMEQLIFLQRKCILSCKDCTLDVEMWLSSVAPWFVSLERDFRDVRSKGYESITLSELGYLWVRWGAIQMKMFAVMETLDPQTQLYWEHLYLKEELDLIQREQKLSTTYQEVMTGVNQESISDHCWSVFGVQHPILHATVERIKELKQHISKMASNVGLRQVGDEKYTQLRLRVIRFLSKYGWTALCDKTLTVVADMNPSFLTEWSQAAAELMTLLLEDGESIAFPDLVEPFALGVSRTLSGMSMLISEADRHSNDAKKVSVARITNLFCRFPNVVSLEMVTDVIERETEIMKDVDILIGTCDSKTRGRIHIKLLHLCLRLLLFYKTNCRESKKNITKMYELLHKILSIFETLWKKQEEKRLENAEAEGSIYIKKQSITENLNEEEIDELEIYLNISPKNYDGDNLEMSAAMNTAANQLRQLREKLHLIESGLLLSEESVHSVVRIAADIMGEDVLEPDMTVFRDSYRFAAALISSDVLNIVGCNDGHLLASHLSALSWETAIAETGDQVMSSERPYDIYQDSVLANDLYGAGAALDTLRKKLSVLLAMYPENTALLTVEKRMNSILNLSLENPLIFFISHVEKLVYDIQQWEIVAARHVSLKECIGDLNKVLVAWRRKELLMWGSTLTTASWKMEFEVSLEFLNFYHIALTEIRTLSQSEDDMLSINAVIEPLIIYMGAAKVGNFKAKLNIFQLLISSLRTVPTANEKLKEKLIHVLGNHYDYYKLYLGGFEQKLESEHKKIGKELRDFIKTQKWGDEPPKTTGVNKCHRIVFKYLRQWNGVIHQPCKPLMELSPINALKAVKLIPSSKIDGIDLSESRLSKWSNDMLEYFRDMWDSVDNFRRENKELETKAVEESKNTEKKEELEKKWRAEVKNLQQRKRNCVTNFVKYLKECGLKIIGSRFPVGSALVTHLPMGDIEIGSSSTVRCIGLRLQLDTTDKSEEFSKFNDFKDRLVNLCDDWLTRVCTNSTRISSKEKSVLELKVSVNQLKKSLADEVLSTVDCTEVEESMTGVKVENIEVLSQWSEFFKRIPQTNDTSKHPRLIPDHLTSALSRSTGLNETSSAIDAVLAELRIPADCGGFLTTRTHLERVTKLRSEVSEVSDLISDINGLFGAKSINFTSSVVQELRRLNKKHESLVNNLQLEAPEEMNTLSAYLSKTLDSAVASIDASLNKFRDILMDSSDSPSFNDILIHLESLDAVLDQGAINDLLREAKEVLMKMTCQEVNSHRGTINERYLPIMSTLVSVNEEFITIVKNLHQVLVSGLDALLTVSSALIKDGFCAPDDSAWGEQTEGNQNEKFNNFEMAGMGDGTGTNDVSDQIESESQLEGTNKDQPQQENDDQPDVPDEEDGIEMSDDFQGKTHDPEVEENEQNENEDNKDELDELEDKMGEVGDAKETDLNKQTWDDSEDKEEEETEKNDDERNGGVTKDDEVEIVADTNKNKESKENSENTPNKKEESEENNKEDANEDIEDAFDEVNEPGKDEDGPEERPEPDLNQPENGIDEDKEDDGCNALDEAFDNNEDAENGDEEKQEDGIENNEEQGEEENIDGMKSNEETVQETVQEEEQAEENVQSIDVAGGNDAMEVTEEKSYDTEMGEKQNDDGGNGNGTSQKSTNMASNSGKMDENLENEDNNEKDNDAEEKSNKKANENRTLGDTDKDFKRKADVIDAEEMTDPKKQKMTDAFAHMDSEQAEDGGDQVLDDATASQQQHIPEGNDEDMDTQEVKEKDDKNAKDDNDTTTDNIEGGGQRKEKEKVDKEKINEAVINNEKKLEKLTWAHYEARSDYLARQLCEQLRNVLEPTKSTKLGGAFRTGKRLAMKKVIPYIASGFRKDKIWLRRNKPSQREYQVLIGVDNSKSIEYNVSTDLFFESLSIVLNGLTFLEVGEVGVCKFGSETEVVLPLQQPFSSEVGEKLVKTFDFTDGCSKFIPVLEKAIDLFTESRQSLSSSAAPDTSQLLLLFSDGDISEDVYDPSFVTLIREANNRGIFIVVIVLDQADPVKSILNSKLIIDEGREYVRYLDVFPIPNYTVIQDVTRLPSLLTDVLTQWFELASSSDKGPAR